MIGPRRYRFRNFDASRAVSIWLLTCASVYVVLDGIATRRVPVYVEEYRTPATDDEQTLAIAVQEAYEVERNSWWIHGKRPYLVFDASRRYHITPEMYDAFDLEVVEDAYRRPVAVLKPKIASILTR